MSGKHDPAQRKGKMLAKARELFWKNGYEGTSIRDIAAAYGCKPANVYNYFSTKEDILYEVLLEGHELLVGSADTVAADAGLEPLEKLHTIISTHVSTTLREKRSGKMLMDSELVHLSSAKRKKIIEIRNNYEALLCGVVQDNIDRGVFKAINVKLSVYMLASMINRTRLWFSPKGELTAEQIGDFIFELFVQGLGLAGNGSGARTDMG